MKIKMLVDSEITDEMFLEASKKLLDSNVLLMDGANRFREITLEMSIVEEEVGLDEDVFGFLLYGE